jgi:hypothetical protein
MSIEAMKLALEALEVSRPIEQRSVVPQNKHAAAIKSLEAAIKQAEQAQPVAWRYRSFSPFAKDGEYKQSNRWTLIDSPTGRDAHSAMCGAEVQPLYPPPPHRQPLTDEEIDAVTDQQWARSVNKPIYAAHRAYARAIEAAHGIKEKT